MKKIKISELPLYNSLKGLFTIGTDKDNRSVKVSLEFVGEQTAEAVAKADTATQAAIIAKEYADSAASQAQEAARLATVAKEEAISAAQQATTAKENAEVATSNAEAASAAAASAAQSADNATRDAQTATKNAETATRMAEDAAAAAAAAAERVVTLIRQLVPTSLSVEPIPRLTIGNIQPVYIAATLAPGNAMRNLIFISDNKSVTVSPDGRLSIVGRGRSTVQVIPTLNTALSTSIKVEVGMPTVRFITTRKQLRFTHSRALRLN